MTENEKIRRMLLDAMESYLEALIIKEPGSLAVASNLKVTFNGEPIRLGDNEVWQHTLNIPQRQTFIDPVSRNAVFYGIMSNLGLPLKQPTTTDLVTERIHPYIVRIHVTDGLIDEVEEMIVDRQFRGFRAQFSEIRLPDVFLEVPIPEEERCTREELVDTVDRYFDGIDRLIPYDQVRVHPDAMRVENGYQTTDNAGETSFHRAFTQPTFTWRTVAAERRYPIVDEARGLVVCIQMFHAKDDSQQRASCVIEAFRVEHGRLRYLMAFFRPNMFASGWD